MIDAVLRPGDALYLPRGFLHSATALGEISAHLTVGVHSVTRWAAAESALDLVRTLAADDPQLRGSLPLGLDLSDPATVRDDVAAVLDGLRDWLGRVDPADVADRAAVAHLGTGPPEPVAPLAQSVAAAAMTAGHGAPPAPPAPLGAPGRRGRAGRTRGRPPHALVPGRGSGRTRPALLAAGELKVADLPGLDADDRLTLARRLVTDAIATVPGRHDGDRGHASGTAE